MSHLGETPPRLRAHGASPSTELSDSIDPQPGPGGWAYLAGPVIELAVHPMPASPTSPLLLRVLLS